jgi:hypothetical protein
MIKIKKTVVDAGGEIVACRKLPLSFDDERHAIAFMGHYLSVAYSGGKSGYDRGGGYWWGTNLTSSSELHRYTLDG